MRGLFSSRRGSMGLILPLVLVALGLTAPSGATAAGVSVHRHKADAAPADALTRALEQGKLSPARYALQRAISAFDLQRVRATYGEVSKPGPRDATLILTDLVIHFKELSAADQAIARDLLARPTDGARDAFGNGYTAPKSAFRRKCTPRFCVHWVVRTGDAPSLVDRSPRNRTPDWIDKVIATGKTFLAKEVGAFGYPGPISDVRAGAHRGGNPNGKLDIFVADVGRGGLYGYAGPERSGRTSYGFLVVDDDFSRRQFRSGVAGYNALKVTMAHEGFHILQFVMSLRSDRWIMEATATWMETEVYRTIRDNLQYLQSSPLTPVNNGSRGPWLPIDLGSRSSSNMYGVWSFFRYLSEYFGVGAADDRTVVRDIWFRMDARPGKPNEYSMRAVANVVNARLAAAGGGTFRNLFAAFGAANARPTSFYREGSRYPSAGATRYTLTPSTWTFWTDMFHLSNDYMAFVPGAGVDAATGNIDFTFTFPASADPEATVLVFYTDGTVDAPRIVAGGNGVLADVPFQPGQVSKVVVVMTNAGADFTCRRGRVFSCAGIPLDDVDSTATSGFRFSAAVS